MSTLEAPDVLTASVAAMVSEISEMIHSCFCSGSF